MWQKMFSDFVVQCAPCRSTLDHATGHPELFKKARRNFNYNTSNTFTFYIYACFQILKYFAIGTASDATPVASNHVEYYVRSRIKFHVVCSV